MDMEEKAMRTPFRIKKEARELAIYNEWHELMAQPGAMASAVDKHLCDKYDIASRPTIWSIRMRVGKRLKEEAGEL